MPKFTPPKPPSGCHQVDEHERAATELADRLHTAAIKILSDDPTPIMISRAKELGLAAIRARKVAAELATKRDEAERLEWLVDETRNLEQ